MESLSTYTRMFIERLDRPKVESLANIRPAIALEQKNTVRTARSTVGTATEILDHLRLLFAKVGRPICPNCQQEARAYSPQTVVDHLLEEGKGARALLLFPVECPGKGQGKAFVESLLRRGFVRLLCEEELVQLDGPSVRLPKHFQDSFVVLDRVVLRPDNRSRIVEGVETAFREGGGYCRVDVIEKRTYWYSSGVECAGCGMRFGQIRPILFSFNHPLGACPECKGFGNVLKYDERLVVPHPLRSIRDGAIEPWTKPATAWWQRQLLRAFQRRNIDPAIPYAHLSEDIRTWIWEGGQKLEGINQFFGELEQKRYKMHVRVFLSRYRSPVVCGACQGSRLLPLARNVKVQGWDFHQVSLLTISEMADWINNLTLSPFQMDIAGDVLRRLQRKVEMLLRVGVDYLTLSRETRSLSGGEVQRMALANQLGAGLMGTLYVLDEPTVGLHPRDTLGLTEMLKELADKGNTVVVVEHDPQMIKKADYGIELGPGSGEKGGRVVCAAAMPQFLVNRTSLTARYLRGERSIALPKFRRSGNRKFLILKDASEHNLKNLTVRFPLGMLLCVTGPSGSGKSTLVKKTLYRGVAQAFGVESFSVGKCAGFQGLEHLENVHLIDQEPIGRTPRSNPITYMNGYQNIRQIFGSLPESRARGFTPSHFSFNSGVGRCGRCKGNGFEKLEMYFFEDLFVTCEDCQGRRFRSEILSIKFRGKSIDEVLNITVDEALQLFGEDAPRLVQTLNLLRDLGLGYLRLGQPAPSLSGGEAQRLKVAAELLKFNSRTHHSKSGKLFDENEIVAGFGPMAKPRKGTKVNTTPSPGNVLYIFDEPTIGLHMEDVKKLLAVLGKLVDAGNTVVVVEHHLDVVKAADWVIDLGPHGGARGGYVVAEGRPEEVAAISSSPTGPFLRQFFNIS